MTAIFFTLLVLGMAIVIIAAAVEGKLTRESILRPLHAAFSTIFCCGRVIISLLREVGIMALCVLIGIGLSVFGILKKWEQDEAEEQYENI